jgi:phage terminase large subunit-like protein
MSYLLEYYNEIKLGNIIVGHELQQELNNLITDLDNPNYIFNNSDAQFRIDFIEGFCKHTKSPFAGQPFKLELWEKAFIEAFYSFKRQNGRRRFKKAVLLIARKNGKSTLCAALTLTEHMIGGMGIDCLCTSNDDTEAGIIFDEIANMREKSKSICKRTHKNLKGIFGIKTKNTIKKLTVKTGAKEGRNIDFAIIDEAHEMKDNAMVKPIEQSQSTKPEPLMIIITTEGFILDGFLDKELAKDRQILNGEFDDDTVLIWLYTQDNESEIWQDEKSWYKSNPSLGVVKQFDYLRGQIKSAQLDKAERAFTLAKDFNIKQNKAQAWLTQQEYTNKVKFNLEDFRGCAALGQVDLSETTDLTSARVLLMRQGDPIKYMLQMYFIPESKQNNHGDGVDYFEWVKQGLITVSPGNDNDFSLITQWYTNLWETYGIRFYKIGYDNALAKYWVKDMEDYGFDMERIAQKREVLSTPMKLLSADLAGKLVNYNSNPIDEWCLSNTAMDLDPKRGLIMPCKVQGKKINRIDGAATMISIYALLQQNRVEFMKMVG